MRKCPVTQNGCVKANCDDIDFCHNMKQFLSPANHNQPMPRGGKQPGAGRPRGEPTETHGINLPVQLWDYLRSTGNIRQTLIKLIKDAQDKTK